MNQVKRLLRDASVPSELSGAEVSDEQRALVKLGRHLNAGEMVEAWELMKQLDLHDKLNGYFFDKNGEVINQLIQELFPSAEETMGRVEVPAIGTSFLANPDGSRQGDLNG